MLTAVIITLVSFAIGLAVGLLAVRAHMKELTAAAAWLACSHAGLSPSQTRIVLSAMAFDDVAAVAITLRRDGRHERL